MTETLTLRKYSYRFAEQVLNSSLLSMTVQS